MAIEYLGLSSINGPLVVLEGVQDAFYDEIVEFTVDRKTKKIGRIIELFEDKAIIQVFEGTENMSLNNTRTRLTGRPMEVTLAPDMLGRTFNGIGQPIDGLGPLVSDIRRDVNGLPMNPVKRKYPRNYIRTGISAIDGLTTLIRGQKLPIFSGDGLPHDQLAAQIVKQVLRARQMAFIGEHDAFIGRADAQNVLPAARKADAVRSIDHAAGERFRRVFSRWKVPPHHFVQFRLGRLSLQIRHALLLYPIGSLSY